MASASASPRMVVASAWGVGDQLLVFVDGERLNAQGPLLALAAIAGGDARALGDHALDDAGPVFHWQGVFDDPGLDYLDAVALLGNRRDSGENLLGRTRSSSSCSNPKPMKASRGLVADDDSTARKVEILQALDCVLTGADRLDEENRVHGAPEQVAIDEDALFDLP